MASVEPERVQGLVRPSIVLATACFLLHLIVNNRYGVFRDELYFIVCGHHPAPGYVDQPPLIPLVAAASHALFGTALLPLRLVPGLAMSATVALAAEFVSLLDGGRFAQWLCGLTVLLGPVFLVDGLLLSTDALQPLTWLACSWSLVRLIQTKDERWWLGFGLSAGISLTSKYLILLYLVGLAVAILLTPLRRSLRKPWVYLGAIIAVIFVAPSIYWQAANGWPFLEVLKAGAGGKNLALSPLAFIGQQVVFVGFASAPVWLAGLWHFSARPALPEVRLFPIAYAVMVAFNYVVHGKAYYLTPIYPVLLAGGALAIEGWLTTSSYRWAAIGVVAGTGALAAPLALPVLPPGDWASYAHGLGVSSRTTATQTYDEGILPQYFADMFGWREMAEKANAVYNSLPPDQRAKAVFFGRNYGEAAAIDVYGSVLHGPRAISGHNNYYLWGPRGYDGSVVITLARDPVQFRRLYRSVERVGVINSPYAVSDETNIAIYVLRRPRLPLMKVWPRLKHYN